MMKMQEKKVGIISCSGEGCVAGTVSRVATRMVLEKLRPTETVTICLPLFLAGGKEEREFARDYPTITVDGCNKLCAKIGTERYSDKPTSSIVVSELVGNRGSTSLHSRRRLDEKTLTAAENVAKTIADEVDEILEHLK